MNKKNQLYFAIFILVIVLGLYFFVPEVKTFFNRASGILIKADVKALKTYLLSFGIWAPIISALLMVFQSVIAPLPAFVITFTNGLLFGAFWGTILSWSSAMVGAALCFFISRIFGRPVVEKIVGGKNLEMTDKFFKRYGKHTVLIARLIPLVSFDVISYGSGLTAMGFWGFWLATGVGQLPATIVYSYLGQSMTGTVKILFWAFVIVIVFLVLGSALKMRFEKNALQKNEES